MTIQRRRLGLAALVMAISLPAAADEADPSDDCDTREHIAAWLTGEFGERHVLTLGRPKQNDVVEVWTAPDHTTWTMVLTGPEGISCIAQAGEGVAAVLPAPLGPAL